MKKKNNDENKGLLVWGLILMFTGIGSGLGFLLIMAYIITRIVNSHKNIEEILENNMKKNLYGKKTSANPSEPKIIYAEKVETVNDNSKKTSNSNEAKSKNIGIEYTNQEILEKLEYYSNKSDMSNEEILEKISILNKMLKSMEPKLDKIELKKDISEINKIIEKILKTLKNKKNKIKNINHFTTYYLPVTLKILIKYDEIENLKLDSDNSKDFMNTVEEKIKMIKTAFQNQLENLYVEDFSDVEAELNVLETMLKSEGYSGIDDFNLKGNGNNQ